MIPETAAPHAGLETNGSKACVQFAEFLNGNWKSIHPPSLNAILGPGLSKIMEKDIEHHNLSFYLTMHFRNWYYKFAWSNPILQNPVHLIRVKLKTP